MNKHRNKHALLIGALASTVFYAGFGVPAANANSDTQQSNQGINRQHRTDGSSKPYDVTKGNSNFEEKGSNLKWTPLGPSPINEDGHGNRPDSGRVSSIAIAETSSGKTIYAGSAGGGVWSSENDGQSWNPLTDDQASLATGSVAIDPKNPKVVYSGTGEQHFSGDSRYGKGVLKSTNGGSTWKLYGADTFGGQHIGKVTVDPFNSANVWVAADNGLYLSKDGGQTYKKMFGGTSTTTGILQKVTDVVLDAKSAGTMYVSIGRSGLWKSTDGGVTFSQLGNQADGTGLPNYTPTNNMYSAALFVTEGTTSASDTIYTAYTNAAGSLMGLFVSHDGGATWAKNGSVPDYFDIYVSYYGLPAAGAGQGWYDNTIAVDPTNPNHILLGGITVEESRDGGQTWKQLDTFFGDYFGVPSYVNTHPDQHTIVFDSKGNAYIGNDGGVFKQTPDGQFLNLNSNIDTAMFYPGLSVAKGGQMILGGAQDNGSSLYTGTAGAWAGVRGGDGGVSHIDENNTNIMYTETQMGSIARSTDGGKSWWYALPRYIDTPADAPETGKVDDRKPDVKGDGQGSVDDTDGAAVPFVTPYIVRTDADQSDIMLVGADRVYESGKVPVTQNGIARSSFTALSPEFTAQVKGVTVKDPINAISQSKTNPDVIYVGTARGQVIATFDHGSNWNKITPYATDAVNRPDANGKVFGIAINPANDKEITVAYGANGAFAPEQGFNNHVFWTGDTSAASPAWKNLSASLPYSYVDSVLYVKNAVLIGTEAGVFVTKPGSDRWFKLGKGLPNVPVTTIADAGNGKLIVGTYGRGAWSLDVLQIQDSLDAN